ncbi:alanyl-tRNA synthetase [Marinobacter psychrophilus]|jgi:alanyl-tRNA synthetase|uniref:Alanine--tRNA ligase n=1 Tax=Marinobacter psychrophilus TaxID=330734 RepID=A0A0H4I346_9GAMM|nr:alanine--tRNA ligase [Marinobacter psychrophilus]AKO52193.1 alanyl-tRNA synthetase [Marinobacter psychrophilus]
MKTAELRQAFLKYFKQQGHAIVPSSSLVPADDPTLLFTNAGMNQFKDLFLGREQRDYTRATSSQKCVRAGGKHNDLENVGYTARHHTFFEMLGNFSFGDYFKREAINFAWNFLTSEQWLNLPKAKLWITVYADDDEAFAIWNEEIGVPAERIVRIGDNAGGRYSSDNFWQMGDTGPCGPCSEIFFDHGPDVAGGPPGSPNEDGDRYIEIWNVVFMQYNRTADGEMLNLPKPSVDTGMGLERVTAVLQGVHSNYEIDLFQDLLKAASDVLGGVATTEASLRVVADHIRSCCFLISDGVMPSNEGRGFVLRRIIRRAARHGNKLGANGPFFYKLVGALVELMGEAFPQLVSSHKQIEKVLLQEEEQFVKTLDNGLRLLEQDIAELQGDVIPGETVFALYDTYGFPIDLTNDIARERGLTLDYQGYEKAMEAQRERARAASKFGVDYNAESLKLEGVTEFSGYQNIDGHECIRSVIVGSEHKNAEAGDEAIIVLERTPFYAESGGQVGDTGLLTWSGGRFQVTDTRKEGSNHLHIGTVVEGELFPGMEVDARIDHERRERTKRNHSATHLLHAALRKVLGEHVSQKGSLVDPDKLRFDFSHLEAISAADLQEIERQVNQQILQNTSVVTEVTDMEQALAKGALALFDEKYGDSVRVLSMGSDGYSVELCGGTHVNRTGDIGLLRITSESGVASGVRRIEAVTGFGALEWVDSAERTLREAARLVKGSRESLVEKVQQTLDRNRQLEKEIDGLKAQLASLAGSDLASSAVDVAGLKVVAAEMPGADRQALMETADQLKNKLGEGVVVLASVEDGKVTLVSGVTKSATGRVKAGDIMKYLCAQLDGKGGGRPDMAQGGGNDASRLTEVLAGVAGWVEKNSQ